MRAADIFQPLRFIAARWRSKKPCAERSVIHELLQAIGISVLTGHVAVAAEVQHLLESHASIGTECNRWLLSRPRLRRRKVKLDNDRILVLRRSGEITDAVI